MTPVKLSRTSRSPTELLLVKSTMENASRQAHENNGVIFKPFTSHQIICANFFSHHSSYLPLACELGAPLAHEDTDLRNICGFRARHSGPKMGPNNNTTIKISAGFFRAWFLLGVWCREVQSAGGASCSHHDISRKLTGLLTYDTRSPSSSTQQNVRGVQPIMITMSLNCLSSYSEHCRRHLKDGELLRIKYIQIKRFIKERSDSLH